MAILTKLLDITKTVTWNWIMVALAITSAIIAFYTLYHEEIPELSLEIVNEANVIDVHKPLDDLSISYRGEDLVKNNLNLRVITTRIKNIGEVHIRESDFYSNTRWGIEVINGNLVDVRIIESSSTFLDTTLKPMIIKENIVEFTKLALDKEKFITLEVLIIHKKDALPKLVHLGKITGIDKVETIISYKREEQISFAEKVFRGSLKVQTVRVLAYFLIAILIIATIVFLSIGGSKIAEKMQQRRRRKELYVLLGDGKVEKGIIAKSIMAAREIYVDDGPIYIHELNKMLANKRKSKNQFHRINFILKKQNRLMLPELPKDRDRFMRESEIRFRVDSLIENLLDKGLIKIKDGDVSVDTNFIKSIRKIDKLQREN